MSDGQQNPTVLLVDDDPPTLAGLVRICQGEPYRVVTAPNASTAMRILTETPVDVVVSDQNMPGQSGTELLKQVHEQFPAVGLIMLTAAVNPRQAERWLAAEGVLALAKPCHPVVFRETVREVLRRHRAIPENDRT